MSNKDTKVEIPEGWEKINFLKAIGGENHQIVAGPFGSNLKVSDYQDEGIPILRLQNIDEYRFIDKEIKYISPKKANELKYHSFKGGDLGLAKLGEPVGKTCIIPLKFKFGIVVSDVVRIHINEKFSDKYFFIYLLNDKQVRDQLNADVIGTTRPRVNLTKIRNLSVIIPPRPEQQKIAEILSNCDEAIEKSVKRIYKFRQIKQGLMQDLFRFGIDEKGKFRSEATHKFKDSSLGRIPEEWEVPNLGDNELFSLKTGGTPSTEVEEYWKNGDIPWLSSGEVHKKTVYYTDNFITKAGYRNSNAIYIPENSTLIALAGQGKTRGTAAITKIKLTLNQSVAAIIPTLMIEPYYLFYYMETQYENLRSVSAGAGRAGLNLTILANYIIKIPPKPEQTRIASILSSASQAIEKEEQYKNKLLSIKQGLMDDLLTGKVRVNHLLTK